MPAFDNLILSHADRGRIVADEHRKAIASRNGMVPATFLVDGFVRGTWKAEKDPREDDARHQAVRDAVAKGDRDALAQEGERLLRFVVGRDVAEAFEVRFAASLGSAWPDRTS